MFSELSNVKDIGGKCEILLYDLAINVDHESMREESRNVFITLDEISDFGDCELIDQMEDISLVNCP